MDGFVAVALLRAASFGTPLLLATLGEVVAERAGVVNLGVEGMMALGALAAFAAAQATGEPGLGVLLALGAGAAAALAHAVAAVTLRANQFVAGLALSMLGLGLSGLLGQAWEGIPAARRLPEAPFTLAALALAVLLWWLMFRTRPGLWLRACGENPAAADAMGVPVGAVRYAAVVLGGAMAGAAGAFLSLAYRPAWTDGMTAGLGWIALALTIFALWHPLWAAGGSLLFGAMVHLAYRLQGTLPPELLLSLPYLLVIAVLALAAAGRFQVHAPRALGVPYLRGHR